MVNIEYTLQASWLQLNNVVIAIPLPYAIRLHFPHSCMHTLQTVDRSRRVGMRRHLSVFEGKIAIALDIAGHRCGERVRHDGVQHRIGTFRSLLPVARVIRVRVALL